MRGGGQARADRGSAPAGVAVLNADDPRVLALSRDAFGKDRDLRVLRTGGRTRRASGTRAGRLQPSAALGVDFERPPPAAASVMNLLAAIAVASVFDIAPQRLREAVRARFTPPARCAANGWSTTASRSGTIATTPTTEAAESIDVDVLRETGAAPRFALLVRCWSWGTRPPELHRRVGRSPPGGGSTILIGGRVNARAMVEAAEEAGMAASFCRRRCPGRRMRA